MTNGKKSEGSIASGRTPVNDSSCGKASPDLARRIVSLCKDFRLHVTATNGFENSQVTKGGIRLSEINPDTMESLKCPGLYLCGELLDLDGQCGGFNLQWAWATGVIAGACAGGGSFDKNKFLKT